MASITFGQIKKYNSEAGNNFEFDINACLIRSEKRLLKTIDLENGDKIEMVLEYIEERTGEGWQAKATGRQLPTITAKHLLQTTTEGVFHVSELFRETVGQPKTKRMFNYLLKLSHDKNIDAYMERAAAMIKPKEDTTKYANGAIIATYEEIEDNFGGIMIEVVAHHAIQKNENGYYISYGAKNDLSYCKNDYNGGHKGFFDTFQEAENVLKEEKNVNRTDYKEELTQPEKPYKTAEEITTAFILDGWTSTTTFTEATPEEITSENIRTRCRAGEKFFLMNNGHLYDANGKLIYYNIPAAEATEAPQEAQTAPETDENETAEKDDTTTDKTAPGPDLFEELAKAFVTGKQAPQRPRKEATQEQPPEEPKSDYNPPEEEETAKPAPGYTGETSEILTAQEAEKITNGEQVKKRLENYNVIYTGAKYTDKTTLLYSIDTYTGQTGTEEALKPRRDFKYIGFITAGKTYTDENRIKEELKTDINAAIMKAIPDEETAREKAKDCEEWQQREIDNATTYGGNDAERLFYEDQRPELCLYNKSENINTRDLIRYIENPAEVVQQFASEYITEKAATIAADYIRYNLLVKGIEEITADPIHPAHMLKKIAGSIPESFKTVKIELDNGETVTAEASAARRIKYTGDISTWYVKSYDKDKLYKGENGRPEDIQPEQIKTIKHGNKILYMAA